MRPQINAKTAYILRPNMATAPKKSGELRRMLLASSLMLFPTVQAMTRRVAPGPTHRAIHVTSSTIAIQALRAAAEQYMTQHPEQSVVVEARPWLSAVRGLLDDSIDICIMLGVADDLRQQFTDDDSVPLNMQRVGACTLAPLVHPQAHIATLEIEHLSALFSGRIRNWKWLSGQDYPVHVLVAPLDTEMAMAWSRLVIPTGSTYALATQILSDRARASCVRTLTGSISYFQLGQTSNGMRSVQLNGQLRQHYEWSEDRSGVRVPVQMVLRKRATESAVRFSVFLQDWLRHVNLDKDHSVSVDTP